MKRIMTTTIAVLTLLAGSFAQEEGCNLPDPLISLKGKKITTAAQWENVRRPEILAMFTQQMYGNVPLAPGTKVTWKVVEQSEHALGGLAGRKQVEFMIKNDQTGKSMSYIMLIYYPLNGAKKHPAFVGMNFYGNQTINPDPAIIMPDTWIRNDDDFHITQNKATEASRGVRVSRWPVEYIVSRGYALATIYYGDLDPDFDDGFHNGLHQFFYTAKDTVHDPDEGGSIAAWAFGLSKAMDYLETDPFFDASRIAVMGHSRLGKTSLWAGATDQRFALVVSNSSGCGGAALSCRKHGETVKLINDAFPHWFCDNFKKYNDNEAALPFDQHELIALIAPRPVYIASAIEDDWADPVGEYLSGYYAGEVYKLYGLKGLASKQPPVVNFPLTGNIVGYHIRSEGHDLKAYDWIQFLDFADKHMGGI